MNGIPQEQPAEKKPNILQEFEFGVGEVMLLHFLGIDKHMVNLL